MHLSIHRGITMRGMTDKVIPPLVQGYSMIIVHVGTNNIMHTSTHDVDRLMATLKHCVGPKTQIVMSQVLPRPQDHYKTKHQCALINDYIVQACANQSNFKCFDGSAPLLKTDGSINECMYFHDKLHLSDRGIRAVGHELYKFIK